MRKICDECQDGFSTSFKNKKWCSKKCGKEGGRKRNNAYGKQMRKIAKELGNCSSCFGGKESPEYENCLNCRRRSRRIYRRNNPIKTGENKK